MLVRGRFCPFHEEKKAESDGQQDPEGIEFVAGAIEDKALQQYLDHKLECPYCGTIRLRIPADATDFTVIKCDDCGRMLGTWGELQDDFSKQGGHNGVFRLSEGRIKRID